MDEKILEVLGQISNRLDKMDSRLDKMDNRLDKMDSSLDIIETQVKENTSILKSLVHASEVHKASIDNLTHGVSRVEGEIKGMKEDFSAVELITSKNWNEIVKLKAVK